MVDYTRMIYGGESDSDDSGGPNRKGSSLVEKSNGPSRKSSGASRQKSRAKSRSPRKAPRAADSPTKSPGKVVTSTKGSKSNGRESFAEAKLVSPRHGLESPRYSPSPAHGQSINIFSGEPIGPPRTFTNANSKLKEPRRPSTYISSSSHPSRQIIQSLHIEQSPQIGPNTLNAPGYHRRSAILSSGFPVPSESNPIEKSHVRRPLVNPFRPVGEVAHHPKYLVPPIPNPIEASFARRSLRRSSRHGGQVTHQRPPNPWTAHHESINPFASFPKTATPNMPKVPGLMALPPPLAGPLPETLPIPPPPSGDLMLSLVPHKTYTQSTKKTSTKKMRYIIDKEFEIPRKRKQVGIRRKASKSPTTTQSTPKARRTKPQLRCARPPPAIDAPSRNTRAMAMERRRRGQRPLVTGRRFGYEELEEVEKQARRISKMRREQRRVARERREGEGDG